MGGERVEVHTAQVVNQLGNGTVPQGHDRRVQDGADRLQALEDSHAKLAATKWCVEHHHQTDDDLCRLRDVDLDVKVQQVIGRLCLALVGGQVSDALLC